ncbi:MAG: hypothetical protein Q9221_009109 [Calogaya cf. arnoldii]
MLGRKRSLRSRRQPIAQPDEFMATPTEHHRVVSPNRQPGDHVASKSRPLEPSHDRVVYPHSSAENTVNGSHTSPEPPEMMIGVALGSPGKSPLPSLPPEDSISWTSGSCELQNHTTSRPNDQEGLHSKASRWKTFGGFFGKRSASASSPQPFENRPSPLGAHKNHDANQLLQSSLERHAILNTPSGPQRDWIGSGQLASQPDRERRTLRKKPSLKRTQLARKQMRDAESPSFPETNKMTDHREGSSNRPHEDAPLGSSVRQARAKASLLQVDIPNIELERYSVMFSSLLQPCQQPSTSRQPSPNRQPSLLARRQASLQELQTTPDSTFERPWLHREHSSSPRASTHKSPSFSLFPPSPSTTSRRPENYSRERSPLQRSATTPGAISPSKAMFDFSTPSSISPSKAKFDFGTEHTDQVIVIVHTPTEQQQQPQKSRQPSKNDSGWSSSDAQSFTTARGSPAPEQQQQAQQSLPTPPPQLRNPSPRRPSPAGRSTSRSPCNGPNTSSAARTRDLSNHPPSTNDPLREAAEISIARQISISQRQRRQLLIAPQPAQPRIVDKNSYRGEYGAERKSHHSHHLVLEDA